MYITAVRYEENPILKSMSEGVRSALEKADLTGVEEVRIRKNMPLTLHFGNRYAFVHKNGVLSSHDDGAYIVSEKDIERTMELLCEGSVYSFQEQIKRGYITMRGGHRVGITGSAVMQDGKVTYLKNISGLNFRFARQITGAADTLMPHLVKGREIKNTLVISPPGCGKTTMLRDIARQLSRRGFKTMIIDERSELAAMSDGVSGYDVGVLTDVIDACPKAEGMMMAVRSMSPQVLVCDEAGGEEDIAAIKTALGCGVSVAASIHARDAESVFGTGRGTELAALFDVFVTLSARCGSGTVESILTRGQLGRSMRERRMSGGGGRA